MIYEQFVDKLTDHPTVLKSDKEDDGVISFWILYNTHQIWQLCIICRSYNSKHILLLYESIWSNLQKQQYVHSSNSLLCFLQTMLILYVHACTVEYLYVACELSDNGQ